MSRRRFSNTFLLSILCLFVAASQGQSGGGAKISQQLNNLINLQGPFATRDPTFDDINLDVTVEFFEHEELVKELVNCFDLDANSCKYPGLQLLVDIIGQEFVPGRGCARCPASFNDIVNFSQNQFQTKYRRLWNTFLRHLSSFLGGL
ncbi:UNVERIFIED_CONTAM: hypothetical protein RMT77_001296 [Armadillidium vulgare]